MNRRQFVKNSVVTSLTGLGRTNLLLSRSESGSMDSKPTDSSVEYDVQRRVYAHLLDPREHPDYTRRHVQPPNWDTFGGRTHLTALRDFETKGGEIVGYRERIDKYVHKHELGDVIWPSYPILFARNLAELVQEVKRQELFLFDIWGYVPGSGPSGYWQQFHPPLGVFKLFESELRDHWLGMDNGEQDGRYNAGYAPEFDPSCEARLEQYFNFQRHFEKLTDELGDRMATLVSLSFGHYFLKEGLYTIIGAETGQGLPNAQIYYAFIRGAGKQYGVPWFGNASVWNRWGWKEYGLTDEHTNGGSAGPTKGTSLSLLKRLLYSHVLYNSLLAGFEGSYFRIEKSAAGQATRESDKLSPIGQIQQAAGKWMQDAGPPGVMVVPIAVMVDFLAGWTFPRHVCVSNNQVYRVWGNLPYEAGDYLTDGVLDMLYPGYQNSSYFHDESGFLTPTPYGDVADCILSDAPIWLLSRYPLLVVAGALEGGAEIRDKFEAYLNGGGHLVMTAGSLAKIPGGLAGVKVKEGLEQFAAGESIQLGQAGVIEEYPFELHELAFPKSARILASISGVPAALELSQGKGRLTILATPFGVSASALAGATTALAAEARDGVDKPLSKPYPLLKHVRLILDLAFRSQMLFEAGEGLSWIICRKGPGEYTLGVSNNTWQEKPMTVVSHCGRIEALRELTLDQSEKGAVGYLPETLEATKLGVSDRGNIAGGDVRIFAMSVREDNVEEIAHVAPPARPRGRALPLRKVCSIKEEVLSRSTFFQHFDSVAVDWRYLCQRGKDELRQESGWLNRQGLKLLVDLSSGINLHPDLRLVNNDPQEYLASMAVMEDVMAKMEILSAKDLILSLHRYPENNFSEQQSWDSFEKTVRQLCGDAARQQMTLHLRLCANKPPEDISKGVEFIHRVGAVNLCVAPSTALLLASETQQADLTKLITVHIGMWLVSTPRVDIAGQVWSANGRICGYRDSQSLASVLAVAPDAPLVLDALYTNRDEEYMDAKVLQEILSPRTP